MRTMDWSVIVAALAVLLTIAGFLIMFTLRSLNALRADMNALATGLRADMNELRTEMKDMRTELLAATKGVDDRVRVLEIEFAELRSGTAV